MPATWIDFLVKPDAINIKMKLLYLIWISACLFSPLCAQKAAFKGVPFGTPASDFFKLYKPGGSWAKSGLSANISLNVSEYALYADVPSDVAGGQIFFHTDSVAGVDAYPMFYFAIQTPEAFAKLSKEVTREGAKDALFNEVRVGFENYNADKVLAALVQKYGQPTRNENEKMISTRTTNTAEVMVSVWELPDLVIRFQKVSPPRGRALMTMKSTVVKSLSAAANASNL
jgi:hypothetical protein